MSAGNRHEYPTINIVNTNYSKYGTSVIHKNAKDTNSNSSLTGNQMNLKNQMNPLDRFDSLASTDNSDNDGTTTTTSWKLKKKYRSLLNNYTGSTSKAKRFIGRLHDHGSSDSFSIFSIRTSHSNRNLGSAHSKTPGVGVGTQTKVIREDWRPFQDINALPIEVLAIVLEQLTKGAYLHDHRAIVRCLFVSQKFYEATKIALYKAPAFTSTYRVAQFVTCLRLHPENGLHVRCIDLSSLKNGLIEDRKTGCEESLSDEDETQTGPPSPEASIDERDEDDVDSTEGNVEEGTATQTNETADSSAENDGLPSYALAGWRDWRYRFDPLYGNQMLNSYNALKRCNSRASSVISSSTGAPSRRAHRSNSSVSSFTNSLMTSFYNSTSLSSLTLTSTTNSKNKNNRNSKWFSKFFNSKRSQKVSEERPRLFRDESKNSEDIDEMEQIEEERKPSIKFCLDGGLKHQPFHESHPYTNKFLLKYSLSKDLPLGYICHLITSCPNLEELNLNNLNISSDFRVVSQDCIDRAVPTSLLPSLKEAECDMDKQVGRNLEAVYLTDSHRGHDFYQDEKLNGMKRQEQLHFASPYSMHGESWISSNYPPPISQRTKYRDQRNKFAKRSEYKLKKIEVKDLFSMFELKLPFLAKLSMDNVVWCCQPDVKEFVIGSLGRADNLMLSFKHAGMGRNLTWASQGTVRDFLAVILLGELLERDELFLQDLFNIRMERFLTALPRDYKILELSNSLQLKYRRGQIECQLEIRQDFNFHCNVQDVGNGSLGVKITLGSRKLGDEMAQRVTELTHTLLNRLQDMRAADLRRHVGQNQYAIGI
ncbi:LAMI_0E06876g1_1 [Lachancea mirantina]|uniref:LAMI_0E06876g1_1 n=1 Tax=Lachancea mirantina TaxID=1230905 RepID=A0A1G4JM45_9SACH|nr:LAMI_0E06876g1_1 [Lachancea mirantina]